MGERQQDLRAMSWSSALRRPPEAAIGLMTEPIDLLLEQKKQLEQLNGWFDIALNNMVRGLSMFDADQRLIVCNKATGRCTRCPRS